MIKRIAPDVRGPRHHARDRAAARPPGRARPREHAAVHARGRAHGGRRPGRRGDRKALVLRGPDRLFVGPDNGLLVIAAEKLGGIEEAVEIANEDYLLQPGLGDVPRPRHLRAGRRAPRDRRHEPRRSAQPSIPATLAAPRRPRARTVRRHALRVTVLYVDRYGNVALNATTDDLERAGMDLGGRRSRSTSGSSRTSPPWRRPSRTCAPATSSSTRTRTRTSRSRSTAGTRRRSLRPGPGQELRIRLASERAARRAGRRFARVVTRARWSRGPRSGGSSAGRSARSSTGSRRAGRAVAAGVVSRRSRRRSTGSTRRRRESSTSAPGRVSRRVIWPSATRRRRSSASTSRRGWSRRPRRVLPPELAGRVRFETGDAAALPYVGRESSTWSRSSRRSRSSTSWPGSRRPGGPSRSSSRSVRDADLRAARRPREEAPGSRIRRGRAGRGGRRRNGPLGPPLAGRGGSGEGRNRTGDTTVFSRVLYQLSYLAPAFGSVARPVGALAWIRSPARPARARPERSLPQRATSAPPSSVRPCAAPTPQRERPVRDDLPCG